MSVLGSRTFWRDLVQLYRTTREHITYQTGRIKG